MNSTSQLLFPLPPRPGEPSRTGIAQRLISQIHALCASWLELPLCNSLLNAEHRLFERACQDPDHLEQQAWTKARRCLQNHREQLVQRFAAHLARRFDRLGGHAEPEDSPPTRSPLPATLSLLDHGEDEERAMLDQMAARSEARHASLLFELSFRLGALAGQPPLTGERLPLSIQAMSAAFLDALHEWELPARQRAMSLEAFDQAVGRKLASLYETINQHLLDAGILPHLRAYWVAQPCDHWRQGAAGASTERRRSERKQIYQPVAVTDVIHGGSLGRLGNLSASGLLLIGPAAPASGAIYQVRLELPGLHLANTGTTVIEPGIQEQWQDATMSAGQVWAGFRIVSIGPADSALLDAWLALPGARD